MSSPPRNVPPPGAAPPPGSSLMLRRFRGFLPVVIDVETGGFIAATDALLQIAAVLIQIDQNGRLSRGESISYHVRPFEGSRLDPASLQVTGIDPWHPLRPAIDEGDALQRIFRQVRAAIRAHGCRRAVLVGHNAAFDLAFLNAAVARTRIKRNPFHPFSCFDTATLGGAALGQTVLAKASVLAGLDWDKTRAHSASYDAECAADLFCSVCNELAACYARADEKARSLGWQVLPCETPEEDDERVVEAADKPAPAPASAQDARASTDAELPAEGSLSSPVP
jgi:ribonuclease T